jgi:hypothetical protein
MKNSIAILIFSALFVFTSACHKDDETYSAPSFSIGDSLFATPNAYLVLDDGPPYTDGFFICLTDGILAEDPINGSSFSLDTKNGVFIFVRNSNGTVPTEQAVSIQPTSYTPEYGNTSVVVGINAWKNIINLNGQQFGHIDGMDQLIDLDVPGAFGYLEINSISIDYAARTGTVDLIYNLSDGVSPNVSGFYQGTFEIINEF